MPARGAGHELRLGQALGLETQVELVLVSGAEVQGVVAAFDWDGSILQGRDLVASSAVSQADLVVRRVEPSYMVLGVVMDVDGKGPAVIPPGTTSLATARFICVAPGAVDQTTELVFRDGRYGSSDIAPILDNLITVGGETISRKEGLVLTSGKVTCPAVEAGSLTIKDTVASGSPLCAPVDVLLDTPSPVQGFVLAIAHDPAVLTLTDITTAGTVTDSSGADFVSPKILPTGGTLGVVLDLEPPFLGNTIPIGSGQVIARYSYCCQNPPAAGGPDLVTSLRFVDGVLGDPVLENLLVVAGRGINPKRLRDGTFTCKAASETSPQEFHCGGELDPATGNLLPIVGFPGTVVKVCFYYRSIPKDTSGDTGEDQIQGLSMALCYDPRYVQCREGTFDIKGTITDAVGAEFVNHHCENSTADGDPGELVIGILVDALPPFDGHTLPPTRDLLKIGCIDFDIGSDAPCNTCYPIQFCDGANGRGQVPTRNLISVNNFSVKPSLFDCQICVAATPVFQRGDCNWSGGGSLAVDIADPAAVISFLFPDGAEQFHPPCLEACDSNDDGRIDFADAIHILRYLFKAGQPPPAPGPNLAGPDPTPDRLGCQAGSVCR